LRPSPPRRSRKSPIASWRLTDDPVGRAPGKRSARSRVSTGVALHS
jgi:hypothetical protein